MTPRHWFKMIASALTILVVGLFVVRGAQAKMDQFGNFFTEHDVRMESSAESFPDLEIPVAGIPFIMNDANMGTLQGLKVERNSPADIDGLHFVVKLNQGFTPNRFLNCELTVNTPSKLDSNSKWLCLAPGDAGYDGLTSFGTIDFISPAGKKMGPTQRFEIPQSMVDQIRAATAEAMSHDIAANSLRHANDGIEHLQVTIKGQKVVEINGGKNGGQVIIRDPSSGNKVVDINGADAGGSVVIRNPATGKAIFEVYGNDAGGVVKVDGVTKVEAKATGKP